MENGIMSIGVSGANAHSWTKIIGSKDVWFARKITPKA